MKKILINLLLLLAVALPLALSVRGILGNPTERTMNMPIWKDNGPLELSPDRGRFALMYSIVENHSLQFSVPIARFAAPDVAYSNGKYLSLFAPALSYFVIPGYVVGKLFGASQVGAFAMISFIALINFFLIREIVYLLTKKRLAGVIAGTAFLFATPAFAYAVTLYQHHVTTLFVLLSLYALIRSKSLWAVALVWFLTALSIPLDNPNAVFMFPLAFFAFTRLFEIIPLKEKIKVNVRYLGVFAAIVATVPLILFGIFNYQSNGSAFQLGGTLPAAQVIGADGLPVKDPPRVDANGQEIKEEKTASGFFKTRNLTNGIYELTVSPDRGTLFFAPMSLIGILGIVFWKNKNRNILAVIVGTIGAIFLLYTLWGDPWGGWAFGARYLTPAYALLCVLLGVSLYKILKKWYFALAFVLVFVYSISVNTLGAITTNKNPPQVEAGPLGDITHRVEKYSFDRNWEVLNSGVSKSFVYQTYLQPYMNTVQFYIFLVTLISILAVLPVGIYWGTTKE